MQTINSIEIDCDPISGSQSGSKYCFIRNIIAEKYSKIKIMTNPLANLKQELIFDNCSLYTLPNGLFENYPHLKTIYTWNAGIRFIKSENFQNARYLLVLDLTKNHIETLAAHTFSNASNLERLELSNNQIKIVDKNAFVGLNNLHVLLLDDNQIKSIDAEVFLALKNLQTIRLNNNLLKTIPVELFQSNLQLNNIYLNDNELEYLNGEQTFKHLMKMEDFDLHNNPIINLSHCVINAEDIDIRNTGSNGCFIGKRTKRMLASDNKIKYVHFANSTASTDILTHLDLANNNLTSMQNLSSLDELKYLDLSRNQIRDFGINSFAGMRHLEILKLQRSGLNRINFGLFSHKENLKLLDISYNQLVTIDFNMFIALGSLKSLYLEGNNITNLDMSEVRKIFPSLTKIGISKNHWQCDKLALVIKYLESNNIALNTIGLVKNSENIKGIPCFNGDFEQTTPNEESVVDLSNHDVTTRTKIPVTTTSTTIKPKTVKSALRESEVTKKPTFSSTQRKYFHLNENQRQSVNKCHVSLTDSKQMELIINLVKLKYKILDSIESFQSIFQKFQMILDSLNNY